MYRDNSLIPSEAIRLLALGILATGKRPYAQLAAEVRHFVSHICGPSLDLVAAPLELLKIEGLVNAADDGNAPDSVSLLLTLSAPEILGFSTNGGRREPPVRVRPVIAIGLCRRSGWNKRKAQPDFDAVELIDLAEAVEKVPGSRILETMIQSEACHRIKVAQQAAVMNHCYENSLCSDFFNSLSHELPWSLFRTTGTVSMVKRCRARNWRGELNASDSLRKGIETVIQRQSQ